MAGARSPWAGSAAARSSGRPPGPFRLADPAQLRNLLENAGLEVAALEEVEITWRSASFDEWWEVTLDISRNLAQTVARASAAQIRAIREAAAERLAAHVQPNGSIIAPGVARVVLARLQ